MAAVEAAEAGLAGDEAVDLGVEAGFAGDEAAGAVDVVPGLQVGQLRVALPEPPPPQAPRVNVGATTIASQTATRVIPEFKRTRPPLENC